MWFLASNYASARRTSMRQVLITYLSYLHGVMDSEAVEDMVQGIRSTTRLTIV